MEMFSGQIWRDELKIVHSDDPDPHQAGLGMVCFPLMKRALANGKDMLWWWMSPAEQAAIVFILDQLRPKIAIEIGTLFGGSLQVLSKYSDQVYSIDIDPEVPKVIGNLFANVRYLTGNSDYLLPPLIDDLQQNGAELAFALVDGDHSANGVRKDINHLLRFRPTVPFYILMHDSFNPECRAGMRAADWENNPYVQAVELDFVPGVVNPAPAFRNQLWGGLALAILTPEKRIGQFAITGRAELTFQIASRAVQPTLPQRVIRKGLALPRRAIRRLQIDRGMAPPP